MADPLGRVKVGGVTTAEISLNSLLAGEELLSMQQLAEKCYVRRVFGHGVWCLLGHGIHGVCGHF